MDAQDALCDDSVLDVGVDGEHDFACRVVSSFAEERARVLVILVRMQGVEVTSMEQQVHLGVVEVAHRLTDVVLAGAGDGEAHRDHARIGAVDFFAQVEAYASLHLAQRSDSMFLPVLSVYHEERGIPLEAKHREVLLDCGDHRAGDLGEGPRCGAERGDE